MDCFNLKDAHGISPALINDDGEVITYQELSHSAEKIGNAVQGRCLTLCVCSNNFESITGYLGLMQRKAVPLLVDRNIDRDMLVALLKAYNPKYLYGPAELDAMLYDWEITCQFRKYKLFKNPNHFEYAMHQDLALLMTTSGSTGSRKLVRQSYVNIHSNAVAIAEYLNINASDRPITTLPMSYTYGLSIINSHLLMGATILLSEKSLFEKKFWEHLKNYSATSFSGVPYTYKMLQKLRFERMNLPSLKVLTQAGGKLGADLSREFAEICAKKGIKFFVMYGQTEATARISYLPSEFAITKAGSIGIPIPNGELMIMDENGCVMTNGEASGELVYKGPNVTLGYAETYADLEKGDENNGILKTGDMACRDNDGFYYIIGRKKRFLKIFGNRVNLDEVEVILKNADFECACAGIDDAMQVYTSADDLNSIRDFLISHTSINPNGFVVKKIEALPRSESGKIIYSALN